MESQGGLAPEVEQLLRRLGAVTRYEVIGPADMTAGRALLDAGLGEERSRPKPPPGELHLRLSAAGKARLREIVDGERAAQKAEKEAAKEAQKVAKASQKVGKSGRAPRVRSEASVVAHGHAQDQACALGAGTPLTVEGLQAALAEFEERLFGRLLAALRAPATPAAMTAEAAPGAADGAQGLDGALGDRIHRTLLRLDALHRFDGLVPLPYLRRELAGVARGAVDAALFALEGEGRVALKISNDPGAAEEPGEGIRLDGRGLIYYARPR